MAANPDDDRSLDMDEPLLSPWRMIRGAAWWIWFYCDPSLDHEGQVEISFWWMIWSFRRSYANRKRY